jgi:serine/threonine-protein kinase HipA
VAIESLLVIRDAKVVATLERRTPEDIRLVFEPELVAHAQGQPTISTSLLVRKEPYFREQLLPFFDGLLPEGGARLRLARTFRLDETDVFGLLREIGRDCAGALSIVPAGTDVAAAARERAVEWLTKDQLRRTIDDLGERPLGVEPGHNIRISLAGVQEKMAVVVDGDRIGLPVGLTASTHILKPSSREQHRGKFVYPALIANEAFCEALASRCGLSAPAVSVRIVAGEPVLLIERYDREWRNGEVERLHQEDFCQALGVRTLYKYETDGGPGFDQYLGLVQAWSSDVATDVDELIDRVAFNYLVGNADAHAKNYSLLQTNRGIRLAPAYDLVSTHAYLRLTTNMATAISGLFDPGALQPEHWRKWFKALDLSTQRYEQRVGDLAERAVAAAPGVRKWVGEQALDHPVVGRIVKLLTERAKRLRAVKEAHSTVKA